MPFCANCGSPVEGQFCGHCGKPLSSQPGAAAAAPAQAPVQPAAPAAGMTENVAALLCYPLGFITGIIFLVLEPYSKNPFVRFHAFQSIFLSVAWIGVVIVEQIINAVVVAISWRLLALIAVVWTLVGVGLLAVVVLLMVKAYQHQRFKLPIIGDLAEKQA